MRGASLWPLGVLLILLPFDLYFKLVRFGIIRVSGFTLTIFALAWVFCMEVRRKQVDHARTAPFDLPFLAWLCVLAAASAAAGDVTKAVPVVRLWAYYALVFYLAAHLLGSPERVRLLGVGITANLLILAVSTWTIVPDGGGNPAGALRPVSILGSPNLLASALLIGLPLVMALAATEKNRWLRPALWGTALFLLATFFSTMSRGAFAAGMVLLGGGALAGPTRRLRLGSLLGGGILLLVVTGMLLVWRPPDRSVEIRKAVWRSALAMVRDRPILGVGPGHFPVRYPRYALPGPGMHYQGQHHAHNLWLQIAAETGILGLAAFVWVLATVFHAGWLAWKGERDPTGGAILAGLAAFVTHGFFDYTLWEPRVGILFWLSAGAVVGIGRGLLARLHAVDESVQRKEDRHEDKTDHEPEK